MKCWSGNHAHTNVSIPDSKSIYLVIAVLAAAAFFLVPATKPYQSRNQDHREVVQLPPNNIRSFRVQLSRSGEESWENIFLDAKIFF